MLLFSVLIVKSLGFGMLFGEKKLFEDGGHFSLFSDILWTKLLID